MVPGDTGCITDVGADIAMLGRILVVATAWLVVAAGVGVLVGRVIRERGRQVSLGYATPYGLDEGRGQLRRF
jgi:hypothetical protein